MTTAANTTAANTTAANTTAANTAAATAAANTDVNDVLIASLEKLVENKEYDGRAFRRILKEFYQKNRVALEEIHATAAPVALEVVSSATRLEKDGIKFVKERNETDRSDAERALSCMKRLNTHLKTPYQNDLFWMEAVRMDGASVAAAMEVYGFKKSGRLPGQSAFSKAKKTSSFPKEDWALGAKPHEFYIELNPNGEICAEITSAISAILKKFENLRGEDLVKILDSYRIILKKDDQNLWIAYAIHKYHEKLILADGGISFGVSSAFVFWSTGGNVCVQKNKDARTRPQVAQEKVSTLLKALTLDAYSGVNKYESEEI